MTRTEITIPAADARLGGGLTLPDKALGLVLFAHGSGSSRHSPRNQFVANMLHDAGVGTLLFDLMTSEEEELELNTRHLRFNIGFLAKRLIAATRWALDEAIIQDIGIGYFGSSTGAAAALVAAAELPENVEVVVSRGGRPDLAGGALELVKARTLLIVGGEDTAVIPLNEQAYGRLQCEKALRIIPGATHLFEEAGALEKVAGMASEWFADHFQPMRRVR